MLRLLDRFAEQVNAPLLVPTREAVQGIADDVFDDDGGVA